MHVKNSTINANGFLLTNKAAMDFKSMQENNIGILQHHKQMNSHFKCSSIFPHFLSNQMQVVTKDNNLANGMISLWSCGPKGQDSPREVIFVLQWICIPTIKHDNLTTHSPLQVQKSWTKILNIS